MAEAGPSATGILRTNRNSFPWGRIPRALAGGKVNRSWEGLPVNWKSSLFFLCLQLAGGHVGPQHVVDAALVAGATLLELLHGVFIEADCDPPLFRRERQSSAF